MGEVNEKVKAKIKLSPYTIVRDTREQLPYLFGNPLKSGRDTYWLQWELGTLQSGDYSLKGYEQDVAVERKSLADFIGTLGAGRARFTRELERLNKFACANVVVEAEWSTLLTDRDAAKVFLEQFEALRKHREANADTSWQVVMNWIGANVPLADLKALGRSRMHQSTLFHSVNAWKQRYPNVHWEFVPGRDFGEVVTARILDRYFRDSKRLFEQCHVTGAMQFDIGN